MTNNEIAKDLIKSRTMANFSHYAYGNLYYRVSIGDDIYQFPISTIDINKGKINLSSDLGTTSFKAVIKGSELNRWIRQANDYGELIKVG